jgi:hypothetical protein
MNSCDTSILDEVSDDIAKLYARILKRWGSSYGLPYVTEAFRVEPKVRLIITTLQYSKIDCLFCLSYDIGGGDAEVLHEFLTTQRILRRMPAVTARRHGGIPRPIAALPEIKAMALLLICPRVTLRLRR